MVSVKSAIESHLDDLGLLILTIGLALRDVSLALIVCGSIMLVITVAPTFLRRGG